MSELIDWLLRTMPPESGPVLQWLTANFDAARPMLVAVFGMILLAEMFVVGAVWQWLTR